MMTKRMADTKSERAAPIAIVGLELFLFRFARCFDSPAQVEREQRESDESFSTPQREALQPLVS